MLGANMISWWYSQGWGIFMGKLGEKLKNTVDFFSFSTIFRTLFSPFRQISANVDTNGAPGTRMSAVFDRLFSRIIGFIVRLGILILGVVVLVLQAVLSLISIVVWPLLPVAPFAGIILTILGVTL